jgi:hypothetical protein
MLHVVAVSLHSQRHGQSNNYERLEVGETGVENNEVSDARRDVTSCFEY